MADRKRRRTGSSSSAGDDDSLYLSFGFTADELEVAEILINLPDLIKKSESSNRFPASWGAKKKRSPNNCSDSNSPAPPAQELPFVTGKLEDVSTSPISPLAFPSPTDSDSKPLRPNNKVAPGLEEIEKVKAYSDELMAEKIILQERRQQVCEYTREEQAPSAFPFTQSQPLVPSAPLPHHQKRPMMFFRYQQVGPRGIPDLNVSPEENAGGLESPQPLDWEYYHYMAAKAQRRAAAARARRNRSLIQKAKIAGRGTRGSR